MAVVRPYRRTCRPFLGGGYDEGGQAEYYIMHPKFAIAPDHYIRAFLLILKDLQELFDYIEPADKNVECYSFRIHALLIRTCIEVEANCKAIMKENGYHRRGYWNMEKDYIKINTTHHLSSYRVKVPYWTGTNYYTRSPFARWSSGGSLEWYQAYNSTKHDRHIEFTKATFGNLLDAFCGLLVILSAQFYAFDFSPGNTSLGLECQDAGMEFGIGGYFHVKFPDDFLVEDRYDFNWHILEN